MSGAKKFVSWLKKMLDNPICMCYIAINNQTLPWGSGIKKKGRVKKWHELITVIRW